MPGVTVERILWLVLIIVVAGTILFGVIYPYVTSMVTVKDFVITSITAYYYKEGGKEGKEGCYEVYLTIKNLGTVDIIGVKAKIGDAEIKFDEGSVPSEDNPLSCGEEYTLHGTAKGDGGAGRKILEVTVWFIDGSTITRTYEVYVKKK